MVASCCAFNCTNRFVKDSGIQFFRFPLKKKELLAKWIKAVRRDKWVPNSTTFICSDHFSESSIRRYSLQVRLKEDAVPSIFDFKSHLQKKVCERRQRPAIKQELVPSVSITEDFPVTLTSLVTEENKMVQHNAQKGQQAAALTYEATPLTYEATPSKSLSTNLSTTSASYESCDMYNEKLEVQDPMVKCEDVLPPSVTTDLPTNSSASSLCDDDVQELEGTVEKSPIKYPAAVGLPETSARSAKSNFSPTPYATTHCDDEGAEQGGYQSLVTYEVIPVTLSRPNFSTDAATSASNAAADVRSAQHSVTNMHTYAITTSPHLLKRKYEQLLQHENQRYKELYKRLAVTQRCLRRRKVRMDLMKNTIKQLKLTIEQGSAASNQCEKCCGKT